MTNRTKQIAVGIVAAIIIVLAILYVGGEKTRRAFRTGFDSTSGSSARTP
jgi:hypothetical protein